MLQILKCLQQLQAHLFRKRGTLCCRLTGWIGTPKCRHLPWALSCRWVSAPDTTALVHTRIRLSAPLCHQLTWTLPGPDCWYFWPICAEVHWSDHASLELGPLCHPWPEFWLFPWGCPVYGPWSAAWSLFCHRRRWISGWLESRRRCKWIAGFHWRSQRWK